MPTPEQNTITAPRRFFLFCTGFAGFALVLAGLKKGFAEEFYATAVLNALTFGNVLLHAMIWAALPIVVLVLALGWRRIVPRLGDIVFVALGTVLFQLGFSFMKAMIPELVPFYADPMLAAFDAALHGGHEPWEAFYTGDRPLVPVPVVEAVYLRLWSVVAMTFPIALVVVDDDARRVGRYLFGFAATWILLGNVIAVAGSSVGPVFADRLSGAHDFAGLAVALDASGMGQSAIGGTQAYLWNNYLAQSFAVGSGISAFPSVHVGQATLVALYLTERWRPLALVGLAFVAAIFAISVQTGYHYAVDGYFSVVFVLGLWAFLRRWQARGTLQEGRA